MDSLGEICRLRLGLPWYYLSLRFDILLGSAALQAQVASQPLLRFAETDTLYAEADTQQRPFPSAIHSNVIRQSR